MFSTNLYSIKAKLFWTSLNFSFSQQPVPIVARSAILPRKTFDFLVLQTPRLPFSRRSRQSCCIGLIRAIYSYFFSAQKVVHMYVFSSGMHVFCPVLPLVTSLSPTVPKRRRATINFTFIIHTNHVLLLFGSVGLQSTVVVVVVVVVFRPFVARPAAYLWFDVSGPNPSARPRP